MNEHLYQSTTVHRLKHNNIHTCYNKDTCGKFFLIFYFKTEMLYNYVYVSQDIKEQTIRSIQV